MPGPAEPLRHSAFLKQAAAREEAGLARLAANIVRENPGQAAQVAAYLAEPFADGIVGADLQSYGRVDDILRPSRIALATIHDLERADPAAPFVETLRHELVRANSVRGVVLELQRLGQRDRRFADVDIRLEVISGLLAEWAAAVRGDGKPGPRP